MNNWLNKG